ncbi:MAG: sulfite oxidase [Verrucomicrobiales bacterium]|nr:sulfite oxidase [Verrucomicrobiales bacterium]
MSDPTSSPGLHQTYAQDPVRADERIWGRRSDPLTRRGFLNRGGLAALTAALGARIVFSDKMPAGLIPAALAQSEAPFSIPGKDGLVYLNDRPVNAETPADLLDDDITPASRLFIRNNGHPPPADQIDPATWTLRIEGESCKNPRTFTLAELKKQFPLHTYQLTIECGGNGRSEFNPPATGNQWTVGAVGCPEWTGVRLRDVLEACGIAEDAVYIGYHGADTHLSGDPKKEPISRGVPIAKALEDESLIALAMNGADMPWMNGHPLRLVCGGWPASVSGKWLNRIVVRNQVHDGEKMTGTSYRVPKHPVQPGSEVPEEDFEIIESMPVKSIVTYPKSGLTHPLADGAIEVRGHAWAGDFSVKEVWVSIDFGSTWQKTELKAAPNLLAWQRWSTPVKFPEIGYYEVWARAVDERGRGQPMVVPGWNPKGYLNNACHRIAVQVV